MKVIILGKGAMLANLIEGVRDAGFEVVGVFRHERTSCTKFQLFFKDFFKSSSVCTLINKYKLHEIKCKSANSDAFKKEVLRLNADIILVGTWREKLNKEIIDLPTIATINVHPSLLPKYRGPNPYIQTILNGEVESGVTFHLMTEKFDEGPILAQQKIKILPSYTSKELKAQTVFQARLLTAEILKKLNVGIIQPLPQDNNLATYYPNISGDEKMLDFETMTSSEICNTVRALHPYLPTYITCKKGFLIVNPYKTKIVDKVGVAGQILDKSLINDSLTISCKDGKAIEMQGLKLYRFPLLTKLFIKYLV